MKPIISEEILQRKGARNTSEIPEEVLHYLNCGYIATSNLSEWLMIDQRMLAQHALNELGLAFFLEPVFFALDQLAKPTATKMTAAIGKTLSAQINEVGFLHETFSLLMGHPSDVVRSWAAYLPAETQLLSIDQQFEVIKTVATDPHFAVREIAWLAFRPVVEKNLAPSIERLAVWATNPNVNIRRFASEITRPRGVWCNHIKALKQTPALALPILEPLKADAEKYVQDSVGNWLNDASKSAPDWVEATCARWEAESAAASTQRIVKKALRTLRK